MKLTLLGCVDGLCHSTMVRSVRRTNNESSTTAHRPSLSHKTTLCLKK